MSRCPYYYFLKVSFLKAQLKEQIKLKTPHQNFISSQILERRNQRDHIKLKEAWWPKTESIKCRQSE